MTDLLNDALREATLTVLLGSTNVPTITYDFNGHPVPGITTIQSAFSERLRARAYKGDFDTLIDIAMAKLTADHLTDLLGEAIVTQILAGLEPQRSTYSNTLEPGWFSKKAREIAVEAATAALTADEAMLDTLRERIGMEVDRNRVGISVSLTDPEK